MDVGNSRDVTLRGKKIMMCPTYKHSEGCFSQKNIHNKDARKLNCMKPTVMMYMKLLGSVPSRLNMSSTLRLILSLFLPTCLLPHEIATFSLPEGSMITHPPEFVEAVVEHNEVCQRHTSCSAERRRQAGSLCCGSCTCDVDCFEHGSCCIQMYDSFTHALESVQKTRYMCVRGQYLTPGNTDFNVNTWYWLIDKCDPEYTDSNITNQCLSIGAELESVVPVTDPMSNRHFRNKQCAYCNWVNKTSLLVKWKLRIESNRNLYFPIDDLLEEIQATRGNIFFKPPRYASVEECDPVPQYTVETCNVTGLWQNYNANIEAACESYRDPFNFTYKNYFCYLCNNGDIQDIGDANCQHKEVIIDGKTPQFAADLDLHFATHGYNSVNLMCEDFEIPDEYSKVCREVFCHEDEKLSNGNCVYVPKSPRGICVSLFLKLTYLPGESALVMDSRYQETITENLKNQILAMYNSVEILTFIKVSDTGTVEYIVAYINMEYITDFKKESNFRDILGLSILRVNYLGEWTKDFIVELVSYNITISDNIAEITVPFVKRQSHEPQVTIEKLRSNFPPGHFCTQVRNQSNIVYLSKLYGCPYISIDSEEISVSFQNDLLFLETEIPTDPLKIFSKWEYEIHDSNILLCLQDYLGIYHVMKRSNNLVSNGHDAQPRYLFIFMALSYFCRICTVGDL